MFDIIQNFDRFHDDEADFRSKQTSEAVETRDTVGRPTNREKPAPTVIRTTTACWVIESSSRRQENVIAGGLVNLATKMMEKIDEDEEEEDEYEDEDEDEEGERGGEGVKNP